MPKIATPTVTPTRESIEKLIHEIEFLLEGRLDNENISVSGNSDMVIGGHTVNGLADFTRPVQADKLFGHTGNNILLFDVLKPVLEIVKERPMFDSLTAELVFDVNSDMNKHISAENSPALSVSNEDISRQTAMHTAAQAYNRIERDTARRDGFDLPGSGVLGAFTPLATQSWNGAESFGQILGDSVASAMPTARFLSWLFGRKEKAWTVPDISGITIPKNFQIQRKVIDHPPNFRVAKFRDIIECKPDNAPYVPPRVLRRYFDRPVVSMSQSVSINNSNSDTIFSHALLEVSQIAPEQTMVTMSISPDIDTDKDKKNYYMLLASIEVMFRVMP